MRLAALATHIPAHRLDAAGIVASAGGSPAEAQVFRRLFGIEQVASVPEGETVADQLARVLTGLALRQAPDALPPDALIHVHGLPFQTPTGPRAPIAGLRDKHPFLAGVRRCYTVDQHNCSSIFWALDLARTLLGSRLARSVVILGGDSHIGLPAGERYVPGCTLMGDAFCGMVLDLLPGGPRIGPVTLHTHPQFARGRAGSSAELGAFFAAHPQMVAEALQAAGFDWQGNGALLPHNVNRMAWASFSRLHGVEMGRIRLGLLPDIGHCYICDPLLLLEAELRRDPQMTGAPTLISVGMGGYVGAARILPALPGNGPIQLDTRLRETPLCTQPLDC